MQCAKREINITTAVAETWAYSVEMQKPVCRRWDRVWTHLRRFLSMSVNGRHSLCLCGPGDGLGACEKTHS